MSTISAALEVVRAGPLIQRLKISGMLSFGPEGIDLPMERLNVLIGPNGSGKSNFIETLALLRAAPRDLSAPVRRMGGISEWLWKGDAVSHEANIDVEIGILEGAMPLRHLLAIGDDGGRFMVRDERIENARRDDGETETTFYYRFNGDNPRVVDDIGSRRRIRPGTLNLGESILSQRDDPDRYPVLYWLHEQYRAIRLYRNWEFGPDAGLRQSPRADEPSTFLTERGENLALLLSKLRGDSRQAFVKSLQQLYDGIEDFQVEVGGGRAELFVAERGAGERYIPASRLSDGTLRLHGAGRHPAGPGATATGGDRGTGAGATPGRGVEHRENAGRSIPSDAIGGYHTLARPDRRTG